MKLLTVSALAVACAVALGAQSRQLPPPFQTPSADNRPEVIPQPNGARVQVPAGFSVDVAADGFDTPRFMLLGAGNEILMSDSGRARERAGSVYVLRDKNADGKIDEKTKIIDGLDRPYGLALWKDYLYVAEPTSLKRYKYDAHAMKATSPGEEVVSLKGFDKGHWTRTILFDRKGEKFYLTVGSGSNVDAGEDPMRAAVHRFNPDGSGHETLVSGTRNVIGLRWYPGTDTLWGAVQERDLLGDDLVPDYFTAFKPGAKWPRPLAFVYERVEPFRIANGYGLFRVMTKDRREIEIEGSADGIDWVPYEFKWKPGDVMRAPGWCAPHQPRLDWQMWFAALGSPRENLWFYNLEICLLEGKTDVTRLFARNPFPQKPPRYIRATLYRYRFTTSDEHRETGAWWKRQELGEYLPTISLERF